MDPIAAGQQWRGQNSGCLYYPPSVDDSQTAVQHAADDKRAHALVAVASAAVEHRYRVPRYIQELQDYYARGNKGRLDTLMRAWNGIKELPSDAPRSFFALGGLQGEPFRGPGATDPAYRG
jgi:hypothetical protein